MGPENLNQRQNLEKEEDSKSVRLKIALASGKTHDSVFVRILSQILGKNSRNQCFDQPFYMVEIEQAVETPSTNGIIQAPSYSKNWGTIPDEELFPILENEKAQLKRLMT